MQGALSRQTTKCTQPVYPAALQLEYAQAKLMDNAEKILDQKQVGFLCRVEDELGLIAPADGGEVLFPTKPQSDG